MEKGFSYSLSRELVEYAYQTFRPEDHVLESVRLESSRKGLPESSDLSFDTLHLEILVRMTGAYRAVEIGTLGGYTGIGICRGLVHGGTLHTFEENPHHAEVARLNFLKAGCLDLVRMHIGPALENLPRISKEAPFDLVFINAEHECYPDYLKWATDHLRLGGVVIAENTFAYGRISSHDYASPKEQRAIEGLRRFNSEITESGRYRATLLPTVEGMTVAVKIR